MSKSNILVNSLILFFICQRGRNLIKNNCIIVFKICLRVYYFHANIQLKKTD